MVLKQGVLGGRLGDFAWTLPPEMRHGDPWMINFLVDRRRYGTV
mgnify:CR=1 FL=1